MKVRTKLGVAIAVPIVLLGGMLVQQTRLARNSVAVLYELIVVWSRVHQVSIVQLGRVGHLEDAAAKFLVTRDRAYLDRLEDLSAAFEGEVQALERLPLAGPVREEIRSLRGTWESFAVLPARLEDSATAGSSADVKDLEARLTGTAAALRRQTGRVSQASLEAMGGRLAEARDMTRRAEQASVLAALMALVLSTIVGWIVVRSIARPIQRVAEGTLEIGLGRFDYRIDDLLNDEFARVATNFNRMAARLGEVDRMKRQFASNISHDLKTPLSVMQETTDLLLDSVAGPLTEKQRHLLCLHRDGSRRLAHMLSQLLELSRLDAQPTPVLRPAPMEELIVAAVRHADAAAALERPRVVWTEDAPAVILFCDPDRIRQLLDNLLENALKFSPPSQPVRIDAQVLTSRPRWVPPYRWAQLRTRPSATGVILLTVSDAGPGVPDEEKSLVFSRFHQTSGAGKGRARGNGVGLGLTICREIVLGHGGTIWVTDNPGGGSRFHVLLPGIQVGASVMLDTSGAA